MSLISIWLLRFMDENFRQAMSQGALSVMHEDLKNALQVAYMTMGKVNEIFKGVHNSPRGTFTWDARPAYEAASKAANAIQEAQQKLLEYIGGGRDSSPPG